MNDILSPGQVRTLIARARGAFPHPECVTCECFLGYLTQLALDAEDGGSAVVAEHQPDRRAVHGCLGCDPCPPADHFAAYLRGQRAAPEPGCGCLEI